MLPHLCQKSPKIAITDGYVEIVKRLGENDFSINGVTTQVWVRSADRSVMDKKVYQSGNTKDPSGWIETSYLDKAWVYHDYYYEDVYTQDPFVTYTVGALAAILGYVFTTNPITAFIWSIATILVSIALPWTKIARVHCYEYLDTVSSYPLLWYRKVDCRVMAYYNNVYTHAGDDVKYYFMNLV